MYSGCLPDFSKMLRWVLWAWWNLMIISNESIDFNKGTRWSPTIWWSQLFDDPQLFDQLEVWSLIIQKAIPPSLMVLFSSNSGLLTYPINGCILYIHQHSCSWKICGQKILKFKDRSGWHSAKNEETMLQPLEPPIKHDETQKRSGKKKDYVQNQWPPHP